MNGPHLTTAHGKLSPFDPSPDDIDIRDIILGLSREKRYANQWPVQLTVAEHSCMVSDFCSDENKLVGLLHDSPEAYIRDVPRPIKEMMRSLYSRDGPSDYDILEGLIWSKIALKFNLPSEIPDEVKEIDRRAFATEVHLYAPSRKDSYPVSGVELLPVAIKRGPLSEQGAAHLFRFRLRSLT